MLNSHTFLLGLAGLEGDFVGYLLADPDGLLGDLVGYLLADPEGLPGDLLG